MGMLALGIEGFSLSIYFQSGMKVRGRDEPCVWLLSRYVTRQRCPWRPCFVRSLLSTINPLFRVLKGPMFNEPQPLPNTKTHQKKILANRKQVISKQDPGTMSSDLPRGVLYRSLLPRIHPTAPRSVNSVPLADRL